MKKIIVLTTLAFLAFGFVSCSSSAPRKGCGCHSCPRCMPPANHYDDMSVRQNVRKALDDTDAQLPSRAQ